MSETLLQIRGTAEEINDQIKKEYDFRFGTTKTVVVPAENNGHSLSIEQRVINLEGQTKVLYDRLDDIHKATGVPQDVLDDIASMKTEITKNIDSLTQAHQDMNDLQNTHPSNEEMEAKLRILNDLITELKTTQSNAQLLINSNKASLDKISKIAIPSSFRRIYRIMKGDSPSYNATDNILIFSKAGDMLTLELPISDEASGNEILINDVDPYSFYIPEQTNSSDPLRARLKAGGLDIQVKGSNAKVQVWCTADPKDIGYFEWRTQWNTGSIK